MFANKNTLGLGLLLLLSTLAQAQTLIEKVTDIIQFDLPSNHPDSNHYVPEIVLAPIVSYEPSTSLGIGVGSKFLFKPPKAGDETRTSNIPLSITYTLRNQFLFFSEYNIFFPEEKWLLKGDLSYSKFPLSYFGLGQNTLQSDRIEVAFDQIIVQPLLLKRVYKQLFLGGGLRYRQTFNSKIQEEEIATEQEQLLDDLEATSIGVELAATIDSRDNILNALEGNFIEFTHGFYGESIGSTHRFMLSKLDFRKYFRLSPQRLDVIAYQFYTRLTWGEAPLLEFSTLGGKELLRGFQEGRFRGRFAYFTQLEYRWQTHPRLGFVFFGGAGDVMNSDDSFDLESIKYSLGSGIRLKIVEQENLNIRFDYAFGFGRERENNFYLALAEAF
ncbi:MAG: BamA/TamA family outer membrane protein [Bacteroidota bacterium]